MASEDCFQTNGGNASFVVWIAELLVPCGRPGGTEEEVGALASSSIPQHHTRYGADALLPMLIVFPAAQRRNMKTMFPAAAAAAASQSIICATQHRSLPSNAVAALSASQSLFIHSSSTSSLRSSHVVRMFYSTSTTNDQATDNIRRYSKLLVKNSNTGVDGTGGGGGQRKHDAEQDEGNIAWMDSLALDISDHDEKNTTAVEESTTITTRSPPSFSVLSWNILAQSLYESQYQKRRIQRVALGPPTTTSHAPFQSLSMSSSSSSYPHPHPWQKRLRRIIDILSHAGSDIICLQECEIQSFKEDLAPALSNLGYDGIAQEDDRPNLPTNIKEVTKHHRNPRNHIVATFWKRDKLEPIGAASVRTRSLTIVLRFRGDDGGASSSQRGHDDDDDDKDTARTTPPSPTMAIVNVHLEGNPRRFSERTRQLQHALFDLANRMDQTSNIHKSSSSEDSTFHNTLNALVLAGDFNCELQSSACSTYLRMGRLGRQAGLGGIHGEDAIVLPPSFLESNEATEVMHPIMEWGRALPEEEMADILPHPFRRNGMTSAYPKWLGEENPRSHFTFCSELTKRPAPGLDQIWFSSVTLKRTGLKRIFVNDSKVWERYFYDESEMEKWREEERRKVLATGLPSLDCKYPSDHLPIGATFDWKWDLTSDDSSIFDGGKKIRRLTVVDSVGQKEKPMVPQLAFQNPEEELKYLLEHCPYDSNEQESAVKFILSPINPPLSFIFASNEAPTEDQMAQIQIRHDKKVELLSNASLIARPWLKRIWKANKQVGKWNRHRLKHEARLGQ